MKDTLLKIKKNIDNPTTGLPQEVFDFVSSIMPLVNVDLLIQDENNRTLLAWRDDGYQKAGWHIPGGILRYKETLEHRINEVALNEIGTTLKFDMIPICMNQIICSHSNRGHAISFLYSCFLSKHAVLKNGDRSKKDPGYLQWHVRCPDDLIEVHGIYRRYI